jgi:hypothetical protein
MKWFDRWFQHQCKKAWNSAQGFDPFEEASRATNSLPVTELRHRLNRDGMRFQIHRAIGGYVVEYYDHAKQPGFDYTNQLQVIPEDADLGQEISKIIMMETLKS